MSKGIFISGTGTDIGKTYMTALLLKLLRTRVDAVYYKAALSGAEILGGRVIAGDAQYVCNEAGISGDPNDFVTYVYKLAVSPHLAAKIEGNPVELTAVSEHFGRLCAQHDFVVAEGSGGIACPIRYDSKKIMLTDVIKTLGLDVIMVSTAELGCVNASVTACEYARSKGITVRGFLLNKYDSSNVMQRDNLYMIEQLTGARVLGYAEENGSELVMLDDIFALLK